MAQNKDGDKRASASSFGSDMRTMGSRATAVVVKKGRERERVKVRMGMRGKEKGNNWIYVVMMMGELKINKEEEGSEGIGRKSTEWLGRGDGVGWGDGDIVG